MAERPLTLIKNRRAWRRDYALTTGLPFATICRPRWRSSMSSGAVTRLLNDLSAGRREAIEELLPLVYADLRQRARRYMRAERVGHTLQHTALVHEAFLKLVDQQGANWQNRGHFL